MLSVTRIGTSSENASRSCGGITRKVILLSFLERFVVAVYRLEASETSEREAIRPYTDDGTEFVMELLLNDVVLAAEEGEELPVD